MLDQIINRIDAVLANKLCQSAAYSKIGRNANAVNADIVMLSNIRQAINSGWTATMLHKTDCFIKKYE